MGSGSTPGSIARRSIEVELKGKKYILNEPDITELALFESHIKSQRLELFLGASKNMPPEDRQGAINAILKTPIDPEEIGAELSSIEGVRYMAYLVLKDNPGVTLEGMGEIVYLANLGDVIAILDGLGGEDENPPQETAASP